MYKTIYNWDSPQFLNFGLFLQDLYKKSLTFYLEKSKDSKREKKKNIPRIYEYVSCLEKYMYWLIKLGYVNRSNIEKILQQLMSIKIIHLIDREMIACGIKDNIMGYTNKGVVTLKPFISGSKNLTSNDRTLLFSAHEFGHVINKSWTSQIDEVSQKFWEDSCLHKEALRYGFNSKSYFTNGLMLLDEVITQDIAENIAYADASKKRPSESFRFNKNLFAGQPFLSNFNAYGELQEIAVKFSRLLDFIESDKAMSFDEVLKSLSKMSLQSDFLFKLFSEINSKNKRDYYIIICSMGLIKDAKYQTANMNEFEDSNTRSFKCLQIFNNLSDYQLEEKRKVYQKY